LKIEDWIPMSLGQWHGADSAEDPVPMASMKAHRSAGKPLALNGLAVCPSAACPGI